MKKRRAAVLILVLLLSACLFVLSSSLLARRKGETKMTQMVNLSAQARELAYAGLESVRVRLLNDAFFPPSVLNENQDFFTFSESLPQLDGTGSAGRYQVHIDRRWIAPPYGLLRVISIGEIGGAANPVRHKFTGEFKMTPGSRGDLVNLLDEGAL